MHRFPFLGAFLVGAVGLSGQAPAIRPAGAPLTTIGVLDGAPEAELASVSTARRLPDGRVVVANGKPRELRLFDAKGTFVRRIARTGAGPGEYRGPIHIVGADASAITIVDYGRRRRIRYALDGQVLDDVAVAEGLTEASTFALFGGTLVVGMTPEWRACGRQAATALPALPRDTYRDGRFDWAGRFWWRVSGTSAWTVSTVDGRALATATLPDRFTLYDIGPDVVVGKVLDADDVESVVVLRLPIPAASKALPACAMRREPEGTDSTVALIRALLRNTLTAQEVHFANKGSYATDVETIRGMLGPEIDGKPLRLLRAGKTGYAMSASAGPSGPTCLMSLGNAIAGWPDGYIICGR